MLKGMTADEKKKLGLSKATDYTYLTIVSNVTFIYAFSRCAAAAVKPLTFPVIVIVPLLEQHQDFLPLSHCTITNVKTDLKGNFALKH